MTVKRKHPKIAFSRVLCSGSWVILACWLNIIHTVAVVCLLPLAIIPVVGFLAMMIGFFIVCLLIYWLLMRWTAHLYPDLKSSIPWLILQFCLIMLSMLIAYAMNQDGGDFFRPMKLLSGFAQNKWTDLPSYFPSYLCAFGDIAVLQFIAIGFRRLMARRKAKKCTNAPDQKTTAPLRKDK